MRRNTVTNHTDGGIRLALDSTGNKVVKNTATGSGGFDLNDQNPDCDDNTWKKNTFDSKSQDCIQ